MEIKIKSKQGTKAPTRKYRMCEIADGECLLFMDAAYRMTRAKGVPKLVPLLRGNGGEVIDVDHVMGEMVVPLVHTVKFIY